MKIHFCGICGTFMGSLALLARDAGHTVQGSDQNVYPPMSDLLEAQGIQIMQGYEPAHLEPRPDLVIIGNAMARGNPQVEHVLNQGLSYTSGPQWLGNQVLASRKVIAVAGTHGKTTTTSMVAWILEHAGLKPGFLIGGVPENFGISARTGAGSWFVVEADEYDTAFFDKRSKFVHYHPWVQVLNNLEFDHADIFADLAAIKTQFHHLIRVVPGSGTILVNAADANLAEVMELGCWSNVVDFSADPNAAADWQPTDVTAGGSTFHLRYQGEDLGQVNWGLMGQHNLANATAAVAAAVQAGVEPARAVEALSLFQGVRRRLTDLGNHAGIQVYDDFAHHPTAIRLTLDGIKARMPQHRLIVALEPRSNTMRSGVHGQKLSDALAPADQVVMFRSPDLAWTLEDGGGRISTNDTVQGMLESLVELTRPHDVVVFMSNGGFEGAPARFLQMLGD